MLARVFSLFGGDPGIYQTVEKVRHGIQYALKDPQQKIRKRAEVILRSVKERDTGQEIKTIFEFAKSRLHYISDPLGVEYIKSPEVIDAEIEQAGFYMGDCDDAAGYVSALLRSVGYRVRLVIISPTESKTNSYQHIYAKAYYPAAKQWIALDCTAKGRNLGWQAPYKRKDEYDV